MMENMTSIFDSFVSYFLSDDLRSIENRKINNKHLRGGTMSEGIIQKLSQNFNGIAILQINNINNMYGGDIVFTSAGPVDYGPGPGISPFGFLMDGPFDPFPFAGISGIPPPSLVGISSIGIPPPSLVGVSSIGIPPPPFFPEPRIINVPSSYKGIEIKDKLINIYNHLLSANYAEHLTGSLKVPSIGYEYLGTVKLIKEYLIRAKQSLDGIPYSLEVSSTTPAPKISLSVTAQLKGLLPQIDNQRNTLNGNKFTLRHINSLLTSITQIQTIMQNSNPTFFQNIINYCNTIINQLQIMNNTLNGVNIGAVPANSAADAIIAAPGTAIHVQLNIRIGAGALGPFVPPLVAPVNVAGNYLLPGNAATNMPHINQDSLVLGLENTIIFAYGIVNTNVTNIINDVNRL